jgi:hypothetical protein
MHNPLRTATSNLTLEESVMSHVASATQIQCFRSRCFHVHCWCTGPSDTITIRDVLSTNFSLITQSYTLLIGGKFRWKSCFSCIKPALAKLLRRSRFQPRFYSTWSYPMNVILADWLTYWFLCNVLMITPSFRCNCVTQQSFSDTRITGQCTLIIAQACCMIWVLEVAL